MQFQNAGHSSQNYDNMLGNLSKMCTGLHISVMHQEMYMDTEQTSDPGRCLSDCGERDWLEW